MYTRRYCNGKSWLWFYGLRFSGFHVRKVGGRGLDFGGSHLMGGVISRQELPAASFPFNRLDFSS